MTNKQILRVTSVKTCLGFVSFINRSMNFDWLSQTIGMERPLRASRRLWGGERTSLKAHAGEAKQLLEHPVWRHLQLPAH